MLYDGPYFKSFGKFLAMNNTVAVDPILPLHFAGN